jgi:hypothetical protein
MDDRGESESEDIFFLEEDWEEKSAFNIRQDNVSKFDSPQTTTFTSSQAQHLSSLLKRSPVVFFQHYTK